MVCKTYKNKQYLLFGIMAITLGSGDAFQLVPRVIMVINNNQEAYLVPLGIRKMVTSITMTGFYLLLYYVYRERYQVKSKKSNSHFIIFIKFI